ncbi:MAG: hypothetical protein KGL39_40230 [Patescibacteria group bacterium]|nr:hypothetical protein [Patescibacteria group bacterium]
MTDAELAAIEARTNDATPGPWIDDDGYRVLRSDGKCLFEGKHFEVCRYEDMTFCAHAREDVPSLLAEVRRLRAELAAEREACAKLAEEDCDAWDAEGDGESLMRSQDLYGMADAGRLIAKKIRARGKNEADFPLL